MAAVIKGPFEDEGFTSGKLGRGGCVCGGPGGTFAPYFPQALFCLSLGIFFLPALPRIFMLGYTKACQVCLIFFHPRDDKLYLEKKQIIGKICMQKTSKVYNQFMIAFPDSFRFGSIQCVLKELLLNVLKVTAVLHKCMI